MACNNDIKRLKDNLTLDFNQSPSQTKKLFQKSSNILLTTPDVDKFKLSTPEVAKLLEKIPTVGPLPTFTRIPDEDEEKPSKQALELWGKNIINLNDKSRKENEDNSNSASFSGDSSIQLPRINMEDQEQAKLERKRLRNRIAASKCRQRKLERISKLQVIKNKRSAKLDELARWVDVLSDVNKKLHDRIMQHKQLGCEI